jgi:predicted CopG family antitoxin
VGTKTISITDDAYHRLERLKDENESFSDIIQRLSGGADLQRYAGTISPELADELRSASETFRARFDDDARHRGP